MTYEHHTYEYHTKTYLLDIVTRPSRYETRICLLHAKGIMEIGDKR